jgi:hypothetical protein
VDFLGEVLEVVLEQDVGFVQQAVCFGGRLDLLEQSRQR